MKKLVLVALLISCRHELLSQLNAATETNAFDLATAVIYIDDSEEALIKKSAALLQKDIESISTKKPAIINSSQLKIAAGKNIIVIGTTARSTFIKKLIAGKKINPSITSKWEAYHIQTIAHPLPGIENALVIAGSDRRGTAFGVLEVSKQIGFSPWYWWADVPIKKRPDILLKLNVTITDSPKVKYRGIFINDEAPALSNWTKEKFGGFNHLFYEKVFELMLRLKANYLWPAMWGNAFYYDDSLNIKFADDYGIVIGTSHHEPLMRAHEEWKYFGKGQKWNYDSTRAGLQQFWRGGMERAWNEKIVTVGMRGDGDEPMSRETATALLEKIVNDQRKIIAETTGKPADQTPQLWALYKEVQDYYDKGMRVPDDVTLLLCDDNWGNLRKLPRRNEKARKGGYGIYYHFDYVGGPRNYKWVNTNPIPRVWEQMHLAWQYNARQIWIVNVGDIKPMEFPISFFLDYAWNPKKIGADDLQFYTEKWAAAQFGNENAKEIATIISRYLKYNGRRKPELLDANTYSIENYEEFQYVVKDYNNLLIAAEKINDQLPPEYRDAFFQLVLHPVKACANLNEMYYYAALNKDAYKKRYASANDFAQKVKDLFIKDSMISVQYHEIANGKWNHMMSQTHIGYTYWQQPPVNKLPPLFYVPADSVEPWIPENMIELRSSKEQITSPDGKARFYEWDDYVSVDASHYTNAINAGGITWKVLPDHGRTGDAVTSFPVTSTQVPAIKGPHLEYEFYTYSKGEFEVNAYFSPTLNFHNDPDGLQYAVSIDDEKPLVMSINAEDKNTGSGIWNKWVAENIIIKKTKHHIASPGKHTLKYWVVDPAVVLQKLVVDFGGMLPSYLGPPETMKR